MEALERNGLVHLAVFFVRVFSRSEVGFCCSEICLSERRQVGSNSDYPMWHSLGGSTAPASESPESGQVPLVLVYILRVNPRKLH